MEKLQEEHEGNQMRDPEADKKLRTCKIVNVVLVVVIVVLVLVICIAIPLAAKKSDDDDKSSTTGSTDSNGQTPLPLERVVQPCNISSLRRRDVQDVIIVGGGPAGTFVGYRLKQKPHNTKFYYWKRPTVSEDDCIR
ncbi:uncharacterized protein LOC134190880 [Corticium candelabrum]|uniref:uncharacterized protein LOC134190880 n=1 Tax=Corticium candelabrum TaxID=121492 RepID=UPI002E26C17E|nr:uncharacterized protein LOC134190880 [Corticium candelabrum]